MARDKNPLSAERRSEILDEVLELKEGHEEEVDFMEGLNDEIENILSCDLDCTTCTCEERAQCMQDWKVMNMMLLKKLRLYEQEFSAFLEHMHLLLARMFKMVVEFTKKDKPEKQDYMV